MSQEQIKVTPYMEKTEAKCKELWTKCTQYYYAAQRIEQENQYMKYLGEEAGRVLRFLTIHRDEDGEGINKIYAHTLESVGKDIDMSARKVQIGYDILFEKNFLQQSVSETGELSHSIVWQSIFDLFPAVDAQFKTSSEPEA
jgi:hypothetical protein